MKNKSKNRRPQTPKSGNRDMARAFQEIRRSNATVPVPSGKQYTRKPKHGNWA